MCRQTQCRSVLGCREMQTDETAVLVVVAVAVDMYIGDDRGSSCSGDSAGTVCAAVVAAVVVVIVTGLLWQLVFVMTALTILTQTVSETHQQRPLVDTKTRPNSTLSTTSSSSLSLGTLASLEASGVAVAMVLRRATLSLSSRAARWICWLPSSVL